MLDIFAQTGIYAPIDIMIQDALDGMISYNLKHDLVTTIGQLTESGKKRSPTFQCLEYKIIQEIFTRTEQNRVYFSHEKAVISSKNSCANHH